MNFFLLFHKSITYVKIYRDIALFSRKMLLIYCLSMVVFSSLFVSVFDVRKLRNINTGLPDVIARMFPDATFSDRGLSNKGVPFYAVPASQLQALAELFMSGTPSDATYDDSMIIVDTRTPANYRMSPRQSIVLTSDSIHLNLFSPKPLSFPYKAFFLPNEQVKTTPEGISAYLATKTISMYFNFFIINILHVFFVTILLNALFLSCAAYFFTRRVITFKMIFKFSIFAISPIMVEYLITSIAHVSYSFTWFLAVMFSTYLLFRGLEETYFSDTQNTSERNKI